MKKRINIFILLMTFLLLLDFNTLGVQATDSQFQPIEVTGFNTDLIAENSDGLSASTSTSGTFDTVVSGGNNVMYTTDFRGPLNPSTAPTYGLPSNGIINSYANSGVSYKLADYNSNNALLLFNSGDEAALTLKTSGSYEKIIILASSANGTSTFDAILNFSDGTSYSTTFSVSDWYGSGSNYSVKAIGRVKRDNAISGEADGSFSGDSSNPRLYDCFIDLSADKSKLVKSISIKKTSTAGRTAILAVAGQKPAGAPAVTTTNSASAISSTSFTATWDSVSGATSYCLDVANDENFTSMVGDYNNKDVGNVTSYSVTGLTAGNTYYYRIRAVNTNGASFSSNKTEITTVAAPAVSIATTTVLTPTNSNSSTTSVSTNTETRTTEVNGFTTDTDSSLLTTLDITRSTSGDIKKDTVIADKTKISEILQKVIALGKEIVQVYVEDIANDPANEVNVTINADSLKSIADSNVNFEISTADLSVLLPEASINNLAEGGNNLFFRIVPIKDAEEKATAVSDVKASRLIVEAAGANDVTILGTPMTIETNYQDTDTKVIFSLKSIQIPEDQNLRTEFLSNLGVYIYHSEDDQELQKGTIIYDTNGNPTGIEISVNKFSTFTIVQFDNLSNYLYKSHVRLGVIKSKSYAYKVANIFETQYDAANVTIEKKGIYYRIYMDFLDDAAGLNACQDMVNRKYIINYYFYNK